MIIVFTANNRPQYMRETLAMWEQVRGVGDCHLIFRCEPGCDEMAEVCRSVRFAYRTVIVNPEHYGVMRNPYEAFRLGFALSDFVVLAEDDLIPADDTLELLAWCRDRYRDQPEVIAASSSRQDEAPGGPSAVTLRDRFHSWIWGTWRDRWETMLGPDWQFDYARKGWDWRINDYWLGERGYKVAAPAQSRAQHIGREGGVHCNTDAVFTEVASRSFRPVYGVQDYVEVLG